MGSNRYDALVVGAGLSGLGAAIRLAQSGKRVAVLERHALWGGLNSCFKRGGRRFDTGLHALTNFSPQGAKGTPLAKLLRQLRLSWSDLKLGEQGVSAIRVANLELRFSNDPALLASEVARAFPAERDGWERLLRAVREADPFDPAQPAGSGRAFLREHLSDERLVEAILLPLLWYGSAREDDIDAYQAVVLFRSVFLEGLARPEGGIKTLLDLLKARLTAEGGELRLRTGVAQILRDAHGAACGVRTDAGEELLADRILSSAGYVETRALCGLPSDASDAGRLSFVETQRVLARPSAAIGAPQTLVFFAEAQRPRWRRPDALVDTTSGVICCSDNYARNEILPNGLMRVTCLADHDRWAALDPLAYAAAKRQAEDALCAAAARWAADPRPHTVATDAFTPTTIVRYTGHAGGAVYGSPVKRRDGECGVPGVHLIGTDQGLVGVIGALMSGVVVANRHVLIPS
jgi:phytoene dehydrogenase-like protein